MYLLLNSKEKIIVDTVQEIQKYDLNDYKVYSLSLVDHSELITDGEIRDGICYILKGKQMTKNELLEKVYEYLEVPKAKISKVITKMKKEKLIYKVEDWDYLGERFIGMD